MNQSEQTIDRSEQIANLIQLLTAAREISDELELHLCAALVDQALEKIIDG